MKTKVPRGKTPEEKAAYQRWYRAQQKQEDEFGRKPVVFKVTEDEARIVRIFIKTIRKI